MLTPLNRFVAIAGSLAVVLAIFLGFRAVDEQERAELAHIAPPAGDALVQAVDLTHIAGFRYVNDHTLEVTDEHGKNFKMELTEACPGLQDAKEFSLVTESYRNLDKFTAIGVKGSICTFKDFSPIPAGAPSTPAP
jgi:hypothetical protein